MSIQIRRATTDDVEVMVALRLQMRREREYCELKITEEEFENEVRTFFQSTVADGSFVSVLAMDGDEAVACAGMSIQWVPPSYGNTKGLRGYISNVFTKAPWRRQGIARKLLDALREIAVEHGCSELHLNASPAGMNLYLEYGFSLLTNEMTMSL